MAKRPAETDEEEEPKVRKRRYNPPKKADDDEDAGPPGKKGKPQEEEEDDEDGEGSLSTGYVALDIALDFRDDCIEWSKAHLLYAIIIGVVLFLIFAAIAFFSINAVLRYLNRPTLVTVVDTYDNGRFAETKLLAEYALRYIPSHRPEDRSPFIFFQGAALCAVAERVAPADKQDYYLAAANYLKEAAHYHFFRERVNEGWFLLGKSLYHCGELVQCRLPLQLALDEGSIRTKEIHRYLAHAYFYGASPDLQFAREHLQRFQREPTVLEEEIAESRLLETLIVLHTEGIAAAEAVLINVSRFQQFDTQRHFVEGQIDFFKARRLRKEAIDFETDPNPSILRLQTEHSQTPIAPAPVRLIMPEATQTIPEVIPERVPATDAPIAPIEVLPMDEETLRELMVPEKFPVPVLGIFDGTSELQQRIAVMRSRYADNAVGDDDEAIIVLPRNNTQRAPVPPPLPPQEISEDSGSGDPVLKRILELREAAAGYYQQAIAHFSEVVRLADLYDTSGHTSRLLIGISYKEMGDTRRADDLFRRLIDTFPTSQEAITAGVLLGELERTRGNADAALRHFGRAFDALRQNPSYASLWLPREAIVEQCIAMIRNDIEKREHANVIKLLDILAGVMSAENIARFRGETYENWATLLQSQANATFGEWGDQLAKDAESKWRSAGAAFAVLAQLRAINQDFSDLLWRAAENYRVGKDYRRAVIEYRKFTRANLIAHRPEIYLRCGEMYLHLDMLDEAAFMLEEALRAHPTHYMVPQIRIVLSHVYTERQEWNKAKAVLQLNLIGDAAPTSEPYRDAMYALGMVCYAQGDLDSAIPYWEDAIKIHPEAIQAADANYMLARAFLGQAEKYLRELTDNPPEAVRRSIESIVQTNRLQALSHFERTEVILNDRQRALGLTGAEKLMLRNAQFASCSVLMDMERYDLVTPKLNAVATMYQDRPEALDALLKLAFSLRKLGRDAEEQTTLIQAGTILQQLERNGTIPDGTDWRNRIQGQMRGGRTSPSEDG